MSTNYYVRPQGTTGKLIHLGKTAAGWPFMFRAYPDASDRPAEITWDVKDYASWRRLLDLGLIVDEVGIKWSKGDLIVMIAEIHRSGRHHQLFEGDFKDSDGHRFTPREFC